MSTILQTGVLFAMGLAGGAVGAVAGGAGLFTFPALLYAGLNPVVASASNFIALTPSGIAAVAATRRQLAGTRARLVRLLPTVFVGSTLGALLLVNMPVAAFSKIFPALLLAATLLFAFAPRLVAPGGTGATGRWGVAREHALLLIAAAYGGFFGAGVGIILLAALTFCGWHNVHQANAVKNVAISVGSIGCLAVFVAGDSIRWKEALIVMAGAVIGGYAGGAISERLDARWVRRFVIAAGLLLSAWYGGEALGLVGRPA